MVWKVSQTPKQMLVGAVDVSDNPVILACSIFIFLILNSPGLGSPILQVEGGVFFLTYKEALSSP